MLMAMIASLEVDVTGRRRIVQVVEGEMEVSGYRPVMMEMAAMEWPYLSPEVTIRCPEQGMRARTGWLKFRGIIRADMCILPNWNAISKPGRACFEAESGSKQWTGVG